MNKLNNLIEILSDASDNPEYFKATFEKAVDRRVQQRHAAREEKRKLLEESIRVYFLDGNDIRLRKDGEVWIAEHFNLDVSAQGDSIVEALKAIFDSSVRYSTALWELGREALAKERLHHYDFIAAYGSAKKWEQRFQEALSAKLDFLFVAARCYPSKTETFRAAKHDNKQVNELSPVVHPEVRGQEPLTKRVIHSLKSPFEKFKNLILPLEPAFSSKTFDVDSLREFYNKNLILLTLAQVHVTIVPDNEQVILHFVGDVGLNGLDVTIYRLSNTAQECGAGPQKDNRSAVTASVTRKIRGNDVRFALNALGLTIYELDKVAFKVKIGDRHIEGRL